jgi:hypothetical protein
MSEQWLTELAAPPTIHVWKSAECQSGEGEYEDLSVEDRLAKAARMAAIVRRHMVFGSVVLIPNQIYRRTLADHVEHRLRTHAYQVAVPMLTELTMNQARNLSCPGPIHFALDEQVGQEGLARAVYELSRRANRVGPLAEYFGGFEFRDDEDLIPLQCADLLAWQCRRRAEFLKREPESEAHRVLTSDGAPIMARVLDPQTIAFIAARARHYEMMRELCGPGRLVLPGEPGYEEAVEEREELDEMLRKYLRGEIP